MKKIAWIAAACLCLCLLAGCAQKLPEAATDGTPWSKDWITVGPMGMEEPGHDLTLRDNKVARDMYYTAWSIGEAQPYTDADGKETNMYDAQLVLLMASTKNVADAQATVDQWLELAADGYTITDTSQQTYNGQTFTVVTYSFSAESHFAQGVSAFTTYGPWAVSVEFACRDTFQGDAGEILADVLSHCHYAPLSGTT